MQREFRANRSYNIAIDIHLPPQTFPLTLILFKNTNEPRQIVLLRQANSSTQL